MWMQREYTINTVVHVMEFVWWGFKQMHWQVYWVSWNDTVFFVRHELMDSFFFCSFVLMQYADIIFMNHFQVQVVMKQKFISLRIKKINSKVRYFCRQLTCIFEFIFFLQPILWNTSWTILIEASNCIS